MIFNIKNKLIIAILQDNKLLIIITIMMNQIIKLLKILIMIKQNNCNLHKIIIMIY